MLSFYWSLETFHTFWDTLYSKKTSKIDSTWNTHKSRIPYFYKILELLMYNTEKNMFQSAKKLNLKENTLRSLVT